MRTRGYWSTLTAAALLAIGAGRDASAYDVWVETVDWVPTSRVVEVPSYLSTSYVVPTSYAGPAVYATAYATESVVLPTSYVVPSSYAVPTSYVATSSYLVPTYYETRFRRSLFGRRLIPTGTRAVYSPSYAATSYFPTTLYYPSSYVVPTTYVDRPAVVDRGVVATAYLPTGSCCGDAVAAPASVRVVAPESPTPVRERAASPAPARRAPAATAEDDLDEAPALPSNVDPAPVAPAPRPAPVESKPRPAPAAPSDSSPPAPQAAERQQSTARPGETDPAPAPKSDGTPAPSAPADADGLLPAPEGNLGFNRRESLRPVYDPARSVDNARRNVLFGRVRDRVSREEEEGVRIILTPRTGSFVDREARTDAFGRFAVRVPDGDWTVQVAMPSGRIYPVSEITVSGGLITDSEGRDVPSLTITR